VGHYTVRVLPLTKVAGADYAIQICQLYGRQLKKLHSHPHLRMNIADAAQQCEPLFGKFEEQLHACSGRKRGLGLDIAAGKAQVADHTAQSRREILPEQLHFTPKRLAGVYSLLHDAPNPRCGPLLLLVRDHAARTGYPLNVGKRKAGVRGGQIIQCLCPCRLFDPPDPTQTAIGLHSPLERESRNCHFRRANVDNPTSRARLIER
jgi:hypothetical protein